MRAAANKASLTNRIVTVFLILYSLLYSRRVATILRELLTSKLSSRRSNASGKQGNGITHTTTRAPRCWCWCRRLERGSDAERAPEVGDAVARAITERENIMCELEKKEELKKLGTCAKSRKCTSNASPRRRRSTNSDFARPFAQFFLCLDRSTSKSIESCLLLRQTTPRRPLLPPRLLHALSPPPPPPRGAASRSRRRLRRSPPRSSLPARTPSRFRPRRASRRRASGNSFRTPPGGIRTHAWGMLLLF